MNTPHSSLMKTSGLTAIDAQIDSAGAIVWWRLAGGFDLEALRVEWEKEKLASVWLPEPPSPQSALRRALTEERSMTRLVRPFKSGMLALVDESEVDGELEYAEVLRVALDPVGRLEFKRAASKQDLVERVTENFEKHLTEVSQGDVSSWLTRMMDRLKAVPLRESGGIYFVPSFAVRDWEGIVRALRAASRHVISYVPALKSEEAATAVLDAITLEAEKAVAAMTDEVNRGELGKRALQTRLVTADTVNDKLTRYESLFDTQLVEMHAALSKLRASLSVAMLEAQAEDEERAQ